METKESNSNERAGGRSREAGFTRVKLTVAVAIIAGLATVVGVNVLGALDDADRATAPVQVRDPAGQIDTPSPYEENTIHYVELRNADAEEVAAELERIGAQIAQAQPFEKEISITHYEGTNALIIVAVPQDFRRLELLISDIDAPTRQSNVETRR